MPNKHKQHYNKYKINTKPIQHIQTKYNDNSKSKHHQYNTNTTSMHNTYNANTQSQQINTAPMQYQCKPNITHTTSIEINTNSIHHPNKFNTQPTQNQYNANTYLSNHRYKSIRIQHTGIAKPVQTQQNIDIANTPPV